MTMYKFFSAKLQPHPLKAAFNVPWRSTTLPIKQLRLAQRLAMFWQSQDASLPAEGTGPWARDRSMALVEAALFAADEPLPLKRLATVTRIDRMDELRRIIKRLAACYEQEGTAFRLMEIAGGYQLLTQIEFHPWLMRAGLGQPESRLSGAARETLAIIAYQQPITRADIEAIRGVQCGDLLRLLMDRQLIRIAGRENTLGRPVLYGTTRKFLQMLGLKSINDLPPKQP